ncbi:unnamed protein product [Microthlaspi erraticum]|uniref:Uncharacterized protein n=1 Tax=Microthlaspi erraticum TaxID=1685480 RepID=A0A6D2HTQ1_9BRAS|nr:unnamed protein product [Microthlaspi erraticum]
MSRSVNGDKEDFRSSIESEGVIQQENVFVGQLQMQKAHRALDEEVIQDGISLTDLEYDLQEGQDSTSDLQKKENHELFDEIFTDLTNEFKP